MSDPTNYRLNARSQQRTWGERIGDVAAGGTIFAWGVVGLLHRHTSSLTSPVLLSIIWLNLVVAVLFFRRGPARHVANLRSNLLVIPSLVLGPLALHRSPGFDDWPWTLSLQFLLASGLAPPLPGRRHHRFDLSETWFNLSGAHAGRVVRRIPIGRGETTPA